MTGLKELGSMIVKKLLPTNVFNNYVRLNYYSLRIRRQGKLIEHLL